MPDKVPCEGCGTPWSPGYINSHRKKCDSYREWSRALPYQCPCGLGFPAERSLRSHKKGCEEAVLAPHLERCVCGGRYPNLTAHRPECQGPPNPGQITLTHAVPPDEQTCVCGFRAGTPLSLPNHTQACPQWWLYRRGLPVKCEGCGAGFRDTYGKRGHAQVCAPWQAWRAARDLEEKQHPCPSCGRLMRGPQLGLHVNSCPGPWTPADWEAWRGRLSRERREEAFAHFEEAGEGVTHLTCGLCGLRFHQLAEHLVKAHGTTAARYQKLTGRPTKTEGLKARTRQTLQERHGEGVDHPSRIPGHWAKAVATFRARYGVDHPLQLPEIRAKRWATNEVRYGGGVAWLIPRPMNTVEATVARMAPELMFTGSGTFWRRLPALGRNKNPDFILPGPDPEHPKKGVRRVIEVFGDYWHSSTFTGKPAADHERELVEAFREVGVECLVLWQSEVKRDPTATATRLRAFLGRS